MVEEFTWAIDALQERTAVTSKKMKSETKSPALLANLANVLKIIADILPPCLLGAGASS
jgi:hypothetical protein